MTETHTTYDPRDVAADPAYPCAGQPPTAAPDAQGEAMRPDEIESILMRAGGALWPQSLGITRLRKHIAAMTAERDAATRERDRLRETNRLALLALAMVEARDAFHAFDASPYRDDSGAAQSEWWDERNRLSEVFQAARKAYYDHRDALAAPAPTREEPNE